MTAQQELWTAESKWFKIFNEMIASEQAARIGSMCFLVYCIIKSYSSLETGQAFPSIELITKKAGATKITVLRSLKTLEDEGLLRKVKRGRQNVYTLREQITLTPTASNSDNEVLKASFDYVPLAIGKALEDIKIKMVTGELPHGSTVNIERLNVFVQVVSDQATGNQGQYNIADVKDPELRAIIVRAFAASAKQKPL